MLYAFKWVFFATWVHLNYQDARESAWLIGLLWAICLVLWCREDAILAGRPLPTMSLWVVLLFWPFAVPVCVLRIYGVFYGFLLVFMHAVIYCLAYTLPSAVLYMQEA